MDFGEFAFKALKFTGKAALFVVTEGGKAIIQTCQDMSKKKAEYSSYDSSRLEEKLSSGSLREKAVAKTVLKERGEYED